MLHCFIITPMVAVASGAMHHAKFMHLYVILDTNSVSATDVVTPEHSPEHSSNFLA